jgi:hypothetical protein
VPTIESSLSGMNLPFGVVRDITKQRHITVAEVALIALVVRLAVKRKMISLRNCR